MSLVTVGIGGSLHDFAACLISSDKHIIAIEDERVTRVKHSIKAMNPHVPSVEYCLKNTGIESLTDVLLVGDDMISDAFFPTRKRLNHHLAHAYSAFFTSSFDEAAILIIDGVGSLYGNEADELRETVTYAVGKGNKIDILGKVFGSPSNYRCLPDTPRVRENSLGEFYRAVTETIGFGFLQAGKTMGLYPYGDDRFLDDFLRFIHFESGGQFRILTKGDKGFVKYLQSLRQNLESGLESFKLDACIAYAAQKSLEIIIKHCLDHLWQLTNIPNLCLAGGVALNSAANGILYKVSQFNNFHVPFAPGDNGAAVGSAIFGQLEERKAEYRIKNLRYDLQPYLGTEYSSSDILASLEKAGLRAERPAKLKNVVADELASGAIVGLFQGKAEFGPRALGNRSILADPRSDSMRDKLNIVKGRESFRPVAPAVIEEEMNTYFDLPHSPKWMQYVFSVKPQYRSQIPACTHVDGSSRVQSVRKEDNPFFYGLLEEFGNITSTPVLINTSFNTRGEPIVETPSDAINTFVQSDIDILILEQFLVRKS